MESNSDLIKILIYSIPAMGVALAMVAIFAYRIFKSATSYKLYKDDQFRLSIERQIADLNKQLMYSESRYKDINHLLIDGQNAYKRTINNSMVSKVDFFSELGIRTDASIDNELVFVLAPFNPSFHPPYQIIKKTVEELKLTCSRGDEVSISSNILTHIIQQIITARLIIADISGRNPNVFYELGIAHALGKPVLIISSTMQDVPFDLRNMRALVYSNYEGLEKNLREWLLEYLIKNIA